MKEGHLIVARAQKIEHFLLQPFFVMGVFISSSGKYVSLIEMIKGFQIILSKKLDGLPDHAFYLVGNIDEIIVKIATSQVES